MPAAATGSMRTPTHGDGDARVPRAQPRSVGHRSLADDPGDDEQAADRAEVMEPVVRAARRGRPTRWRSGRRRRRRGRRGPPARASAAAARRGSRAAITVPPPTTSSPSYSTPAWPGATWLTGGSQRSSTEPRPRPATVTGARRRRGRGAAPTSRAPTAGGASIQCTSASRTGVALERGARPDGDRVGGGVDGDDEERGRVRPRRSDAEPGSLAHGVEGHAPVLAHDRRRRRRRSAPAGSAPRGAARGRPGSSRRRSTAPGSPAWRRSPGPSSAACRRTASFDGLGAEREQRREQLALVEPVQRVRLVLGGGAGAMQRGARRRGGRCARSGRWRRASRPPPGRAPAARRT